MLNVLYKMFMPDFTRQNEEREQECSESVQVFKIHPNMRNRLFQKSLVLILGNEDVNDI